MFVINQFYLTETQKEVDDSSPNVGSSTQNVVCLLRQIQHLSLRKSKAKHNVRWQSIFAMTETQKEVEDDSSTNVGSSTSKCHLFIEADTAFVP
ncbi:hypothetical protein CEXT_283171 [Caerostris extrusa]|uniref:Uncharacterized protein n=1 Tax=Caerostris extrusa TaxID=172846 RepID=A0AAV4UTG9_CAEEX|nr:hypothetical protein CEXT_283171 [Caerostris extrusa]